MKTGSGILPLGNEGLFPPAFIGEDSQTIWSLFNMVGNKPLINT